MENCNMVGAFAQVLDAVVVIQAVTRGWWVRQRSWSPKQAKASDLLFQFKSKELEEEIKWDWDQRLSCQNDFSAEHAREAAGQKERSLRALNFARVAVLKRESETAGQKAMRLLLLKIEAEACAELYYYQELDAQETRHINEAARQAVRRKHAVKELDVDARALAKAQFEKTSAAALQVMIVRDNVKARGLVPGCYRSIPGLRAGEVHWRTEMCDKCGGGDIGGKFFGVAMGTDLDDDCRETQCVKCAAEASWANLIPADLTPREMFGSAQPYM
jgi:hypothetical protein